MLKGYRMGRFTTPYAQGVKMSRFTTPYAQGVKDGQVYNSLCPRGKGWAGLQLPLPRGYKIHLSSLCFSVDPLKMGLLGVLGFGV